MQVAERNLRQSRAFIRASCARSYLKCRVRLSVYLSRRASTSTEFFVECRAWEDDGTS